jgi:hypothetical protein
VGPTFACIISRQFNDLRRGDRFFYETQNPSIRFTSGIDENLFYFLLILKIDQLNEIRRMTLSSILCQTVEGISEVQINAFRMANNFE